MTQLRELDDDALIDLMKRETPEEDAPPLEFVLQPIVALQLVGLLQLALRHPSGGGEIAREAAVAFIHGVRMYFRAAGAPAMLEAIRRGYETPTSITCDRCGRVSHNLHDVEHRYCGACHRFADDEPIPLGSN